MVKFSVLLKKFVFLAIGVFMLSGISLKAQDRQDFFFQKLTTNNGLSSNFIQCIFRDSRGFVWIGTNYGLNRYDGRNIKVYHHDVNNPHSLPKEEIHFITEDKDGIIWLHSNYGLIEFNPVSEQFNVHRHDAGDPKSLISNQARPFVDSKNNLWVSTSKGVQLFDRKGRMFETFLLSSPDSIQKNPSLGYAGCLLEDQEHNIWCFGKKGLFRFDEHKREFQLFPFQDKSYGDISDIFIDHEGNFWVVFWDTGINLFHPESGVFEAISPFKVNRFSIFGKMSEWRDPFGVYWLTICTERGLFLYNCKSGEKAILQNDHQDANSLLFNGVYYVYTDQENLLWVGTKKGISFLDNADQAFCSQTLAIGTFSEDEQKDGFLETMYEDPDVKMVSFRSEKGVGIYDAKWNLIKNYLAIPPTDTNRYARNISGVYRDSRGIYWISTSINLVRFDLKTNLFTRFYPSFGKKDTENVPKYLDQIIPCDSTSFYVLSRTLGIYRFDFIKEKFVQHLVHDDKDPASLPVNKLLGIIQDEKKRLLIISESAGIFIFNPGQHSFEIYSNHPDISINEALHNLEVDPALAGHKLWLNSAQGLLEFDLQTRKFQLFNSRHGLANDNLFSNEVDSLGNVWVAHNAGISRFDTAAHTFINYNNNNGLIFQALNHNMRKMADGKIYIGDRNQLISFNPLMLKVNRNIPQVHINSVQVMNEPCGMTIDSVSHKKILTLNYDQNLIRVDFSVLNFSHPGANRFFYRLDKDTIWHKLNEGSVNLVRLSPGKYVLHVTGSNDSGIMNPKGDVLYINILPPYYETWWFRLVLAIIIVAIFVETRRRGIARIKRVELIKTQFNKQLAQAETKALRAQMNPHFIFNSLNSINSFVIDRKHEIASDYLIKFSKLIRLILDNSRSELIPLEKELETLKLYVSLESARFDNKFSCCYLIDQEVNINSVMIPPMLLQPFVENAIWHGLMQKENPGTIMVKIKKEDDEFLNISIIDDGIGRAKAAELKSKSATHKSHGLKVTSQRIEMMNKLNSTGARVNLIDLTDDQGRATGTKVELIIPY